MKLFVLVISLLASSAFAAPQKSIQSRLNKGGRIIGGQPARAGQFPYAAAINWRTSDARYFCAGSVINTQYILTAGQCVNKGTTFDIRLGSTHLNSSDAVEVATSTYYLNPDFNEMTLENDIGLLHLHLPIEYTDYIKPIALPAVDVPGSARAIAIGWGQISDDQAGLSNALNYVSLAILSNEECKATFGDQIADHMVCVEGNLNEGTCNSDTGGPLVVILIGGTNAFVAGVSSFISGNGCESTDPSGYTRVYPFLDFINSTISG